MTDDLFNGLIRFSSDAALKKKINFLMEEWRRTFPDLNLQSEIQFAHYWLVTHGVHRKRQDIYLSNWMKKAYQISKEKPKFGVLARYREQKPNLDDVMTGDDFAAMRKAIK